MEDPERLVGDIANSPWSSMNRGDLQNPGSSSRGSRSTRSSRSISEDDGNLSPPPPSNVAASTRSRGSARSNSRMLDSPEKTIGLLPSLSTSSRSTRQTSRTKIESPSTEDLADLSFRAPGQSGRIRPVALRRQPKSRQPTRSPAALEQDEPQVPLAAEPSRVSHSQSLTPEPSVSVLPSDLQSPNPHTNPEKRKAPLDEDNNEAPLPNGGSSYDATPRTSPILADDAQLPGNVDSADQLDTAKGGGPKRAPRKKRKWLKKGEVDPDDPVAVAKQKERHMLLDQADELLVQQIDSIHDGSHTGLTYMLAELDRRRDALLQRVQARQERAVEELDLMRNHAVLQAHAEFREQGDQLLATLRDELRHFKHRIIAQTSLAKKPVQTDPLRREVHGIRSWRVYDSRLLSRGTQRVVQCDMDGIIRERRDHGPVGKRMPIDDAREELADIRDAIRASEYDMPSPGGRPSGGDSSSRSKSHNRRKPKVLSVHKPPEELPPSRFNSWEDLPSNTAATAPKPYHALGPPSAIPSWGPTSAPKYAGGEPKPQHAYSSTLNGRPPQSSSIAKAFARPATQSFNAPSSMHALPQSAGHRISATTPNHSPPIGRPGTIGSVLSPMPQHPSPGSMTMAHSANRPLTMPPSTSIKSTLDRPRVDPLGFY